MTVEQIKQRAVAENWEIGDIIEALVAAYCAAYDLSAAYDINSGMCEDFAEDLAYLVPDVQTYWHDELQQEGDPIYNPHKFVKLAGQYYDAECPDGVDDWQQLPFFVRDMAYLGYPG